MDALSVLLTAFLTLYLVPIVLGSVIFSVIFCFIFRMMVWNKPREVHGAEVTQEQIDTQIALKKAELEQSKARQQEWIHPKSEKGSPGNGAQDSMHSNT